MYIVALNTSAEQAELYLFNGQEQIATEIWLAHRQLADSIHSKIEQLLASNKLTWQDIGGLAVYKGPGSFTGLRIGMSVANALALGISVPAVARTGSGWLQESITALMNGVDEKVIVPEYGGMANITSPKK